MLPSCGKVLNIMGYDLKTLLSNQVLLQVYVDDNPFDVGMQTVGSTCLCIVLELN